MLEVLWNWVALVAATPFARKTGQCHDFDERRLYGTKYEVLVSGNEI
jgi:hypothetical protein